MARRNRDAVPSSDEPPAEVLEELLRAFGVDDPAAAAQIDLDDPAIDELLGIESEHAEPDEPDELPDLEPPTAETPVQVDEGERDQDAQVDDADDDSEDGAAAQESAGEKAPAGEPRIIVIADDDLPDTEYLDEDTEQRLRARDDTDRSTIVIGDADDGTTDPVTIANSSMEPRLRERRIAVGRAAGRKRLKIVLVIAAVLIVLAATVGILATYTFAVRDVRVEGVSYADPEALATIVAEIEGDQMLLVNSRDIELRLERLAWVESARVDKDFPHTIVLDIRERTPVAYFQGADGRVRVIDRESRVLDVIDGLPVAYAHITSVGPDVPAGQFAGAPYATAAAVVVALPAELRAKMTSMALDPVTNDLTLILEERVEVFFGDGTDVSDKLGRLLQVVRNGLDEVVAIDVTSDDPSITRTS
jgi:cell division septal protein FtsQ